MPQAIVIAIMLAALPSGGRVLPARGFDVPTPQPRTLQLMANSLNRAEVAGRDPKKIREWRDNKQTHAIFWTAKSNAYRAYKIEGDRYVQLLDAKNNLAVAEPRFQDSMYHIDRHWRMMTGPPKIIEYRPSPTKKRMQEPGRQCLVLAPGRSSRLTLCDPTI